MTLLSAEMITAVPLLAAGSVSTPFPPIVVLLLCVLTGVGTYLALPGRRGVTWRQVGGILTLSGLGVLAALLINWTVKQASFSPSYAYFWIFSAIAVGGAIRVVTHSRPVYSALYFILTVFASAGLFLLLWAEFMAAALVLIYAGAILVTYVFVIMLASEASGSAGSAMGLAEHDAQSREPLLATLAGFVLLGVIMFVIFEKDTTIPRAPDLATAGLTFNGQPAGSTQMLGAFLFKYHFINIQMAGLLLTLAMVGAIMIARKKVVDSRGAGDISPLDRSAEVVVGPHTPLSDDPHSIEVVGTRNPKQKAYPEN